MDVTDMLIVYHTQLPIRRRTMGFGPTRRVFFTTISGHEATTTRPPDQDVFRAPDEHQN